MAIKLKVEGIIKLQNTLKAYPTRLRIAILKAQEETAKEYLRLVYQEFEQYETADDFYQRVLTNFDEMITSHTYDMRDGLKIQEVNGDHFVGCFNDDPYYAKYVLLGTWKMLPRNPILKALDEMGIEYGTVLPIMSRGFDDPAIARAYYQGVRANFDALVISRSGRMKETLEMRFINGKWRVGWFENAPDYTKFVLMGTYQAYPRNPLIHAFNHEYLLNYMEKSLKNELARAA